MNEPEAASRQQPVLSLVLYFIKPAPFLNEALASILSQADPEVELVVVAGHAPDTDLGIDPAHLRRIDRLIVEPDAGAWDAANKGWTAARGRWIQFVMADDVLPPASLAATLAVLAERDCDLVSGRMSLFHHDHGDRHQIASHDAQPLSLGRVLGTLCSPATLYRRALLERLGGFDGRFAYAHDRELLLRAWRGGARAETMPHEVYRMRIHDQSRTLSGDRGVVLSYLREHVAFADQWLARADLAEHEIGMLRRWRDEEALKYRLQGGGREHGASRNATLTLRRALGAALRIASRKLCRIASRPLRGRRPVEPG
jgi:glycosyltransferase involved in cell wall biosynthesis